MGSTETNDKNNRVENETLYYDKDSGELIRDTNDTLPLLEAVKKILAERGWKEVIVAMIDEVFVKTPPNYKPFYKDGKSTLSWRNEHGEECEPPEGVLYVEKRGGKYFGEGAEELWLSIETALSEIGWIKKSNVHGKEWYILYVNEESRKWITHFDQTGKIFWLNTDTNEQVDEHPAGMRCVRCIDNSFYNYVCPITGNRFET